MNNEKVKFLLNWNHFAEHLSSCMTKLMTDSSYSDIIIATADKRMIYSHRFVLANSSKYFQKLLKHLNRQGRFQLIVALPEIKYEIFKILMNYMYKGETQVPHELLPSVIKAGQFLEINGLVNLNENESSSYNEELTKFNSTGESYSRYNHFSSYSSSLGNEDTKVRISSTLRNKIHSKENSDNSSQKVFHIEKRTRKRVITTHQSSESLTTEESGKENRSKLTKSSKYKNQLQEKKDFIQLPLKRKLSVKKSDKKRSPTSFPSPSLSTESFFPPKKKKIPVSQEVFSVKIKDEKENSASPVQENNTLDMQDLEEKVTIKMEAPEKIDEDIYNELQCDFCHEIYTNPSDWVKHMTEQHGDRGYQAYKDLDKSVGSSAVITCVICSCVCFSATEWAKHLQVWHSDKELAVVNMNESKKNGNKI